MSTEVKSRLTNLYPLKHIITKSPFTHDLKNHGKEDAHRGHAQHSKNYTLQTTLTQSLISLYSFILLPSSLPSFTPSLPHFTPSLPHHTSSLHSLTSTPPPHRTHQRQDVEESHLEVHDNNVVMVLDGPDVLVVVAEEILIELVLV